MAEHMRNLLEERRDLPPHFDLISMLAHNEATRDMPFPELISNMMLLIVAGNDTTRVHEQVTLRIDPETCHLFDAEGRALPHLTRHPLAEMRPTAPQAQQAQPR